MAEEHVAQALLPVLKSENIRQTDAIAQKSAIRVSFPTGFGEPSGRTPGMFRNKWLSTWAQRLFCGTSVC